MARDPIAARGNARLGGRGQVLSDPRSNNHVAGIVLMLAAVLVVSLNDVLGKWLVATHSVVQYLVLCSIAALLLAPLI